MFNLGSFYCNLLYVFVPNWPSSNVQVVFLRAFLYRLSTAVAEDGVTLVTYCSHERIRVMVFIVSSGLQHIANINLPAAIIIVKQNKCP
jgi:hypothetical protein